MSVSQKSEYHCYCVDFAAVKILAGNYGLRQNSVGKTNKSSGDLRKSVCMEDLPLSLSIYMQHGELG